MISSAENITFWSKTEYRYGLSISQDNNNCITWNTITVRNFRCLRYSILDVSESFRVLKVCPLLASWYQLRWKGSLTRGQDRHFSSHCWRGEEQSNMHYYTSSKIPSHNGVFTDRMQKQMWNYFIHANETPSRVAPNTVDRVSIHPWSCESVSWHWNHYTGEE